VAGPFRQRPSVAELNRGAENSAISTLGILITEIGDDFVRGTMPVDARTKQPYGLLHGGSSVLLAESLASTAANLCLDDPQRQQAVGVEINANHLRAVTSGTVTGTARPINVGRSIQVWDIRIEDEQGRAVCVSRLTLAVRSS
jgi:uncharacterized protein (TIGR00369 family)